MRWLHILKRCKAKVGCQIYSIVLMHAVGSRWIEVIQRRLAWPWMTRTWNSMHVVPKQWLKEAWWKQTLSAPPDFLKIQTDLQYRLETTAGFVWQMSDFKMYETDPQIWFVPFHAIAWGWSLGDMNMICLHFFCKQIGGLFWEPFTNVTRIMQQCVPQIAV